MNKYKTQIMLVRFVVSNYLSFGEETEFNMLTGSVRRKKEHIYQFGDIELLKTAAIYGPNGAGKSNLIKAISLLKNCVQKGYVINGVQFDSFRLNPENKKKPTKLEIEFVSKGNVYAYSINIHNDEIIEEWLYKIKNQKEELVFERQLVKGKTKIKFNENLLQTEEDKLRVKLYEEEFLLGSRTLLGMMSETKRQFEDIQNAFLWFRENLIIIFPNSEAKGLAARYYSNDKYKKFVDNVFETIDTGVKKIEFEDIELDQYFGLDDKGKADRIRRNFEVQSLKYLPIDEKNKNQIAVAVEEKGKIIVKKLITSHYNENNEKFKFEIKEESDGTKRILDFSASLEYIIRTASTFLIDEIDQSIHPHLLKKLVAKFVNDNNTKGQLIFTTHDSNLLDQNIFRQDEIWFTEKKKTGETTMYPLSDYKIRYDLDIEKGYLKGRFGAIPFLGNLDDLNWHEYAS